MHGISSCKQEYQIELREVLIKRIMQTLSKAKNFKPNSGVVAIVLIDHTSSVLLLYRQVNNCGISERNIKLHADSS